VTKIDPRLEACPRSNEPSIEEMELTEIPSVAG
jgi:hypothetical protein